MKKTVIVINGRGGCGKDTICAIAGKYYPVMNISSITPIKEIAMKAGWDGEKDAKARKLLSNLKQVLTEYNDLPHKYIMDELDKFMKGDEKFLFIHIREPEEIERFVKDASGKCNTISLLVKRITSDYSNEKLGNRSDDDVEKYEYDYTFINKANSVDDLKNDVKEFLKDMVAKEERKQAKKREDR